MGLAFRHLRNLGFVLLAALPVSGQLVLTRASQIKSFNQDLIVLSTASGEVVKARIKQVTQARLAALSELIPVDPGAALQLALPDAVLERLRSVMRDDSGALLESRGEWTGSVTVMIEDDFAHGASRTHTSLSTGGHALKIHFAGVTPNLQSGAVLRAKGLRIGDMLAVSESKVASSSATSLGCSMIGPQKIAVLLVNFASSQIPATIDAAYVKGIISGAGHSLDGYWREASGGLVSASGDVYGPFNLGVDFPSGKYDEVRDAAIYAASSSVTFQNYSHIIIVMPPGFPWGNSIGLGSVGCYDLNFPSTGSFQAGVSWLRSDYLIPNDFGVCLAAHENGHNLGLNHASTESYGSIPLGAIGTVPVHDEYGDRFSLMGRCNTFNSITPLGHYAAQQKVSLGWLGPQNYQNVTSSGTFTLKPFESGLSGMQALRVQRGAGNDVWLWLEYRQPVGYDATFGIAGISTRVYSGAVIHYEDPTVYSGYTRLLNFTADTVSDFSQPALAAGSTWSDPYSPLTIRVNSATAAGLNVSINYDAPCASLTPLSRSYNSAAAVVSDSVSVTAPGACLWSAGSNADWITVTGGLSGSGNGSVTYSLSANTGAMPRTSGIAIGRQNVTITQATSNAQPTPVSVTPLGGSSIAGRPQMFQFVYSDGDGAKDLTQVGLLFGRSVSTVGACHLTYQASDNTVALYADDSVNFSTLHPGDNGILSNSQCTVDLSITSVAVAGNKLTFNVGITFLAPFVGTKNIYLEAQDLPGADSGLVKLGAWTVAPGYGVAGQVTLQGGAALSGVTMTLGGSQAGSTTTDAAGSYSFSGLSAGGTYTITPARSGYTFIPPSATFSNLGSNQTANFVATVPQLSIVKAHTGNFSQGQNGAMYTLTVSNAAAAGPTSGMITVTEAVPTGLTLVSMAGTGWSCIANTCTRSDALNGGAGYPPITVVVNVASNAPASITNQASVSGGGSAAANAMDPAMVQVTPLVVSGQVTVSGLGLGGVTINVSGSQTLSTTTDASGKYNVTLNGSGTYTLAPALSGYSFSPTSATFSNVVGNQVANFAGVSVTGLAFYPVTPCRVADTRVAAGFTGAFGPPSMAGGSTRTFAVPASGCGIPANAVAYSLNFTVVPPAGGPQANLTTWPTGLASGMPNVSTLNYSGRVVANAAIVPAGVGGAIDVFVNYPAEVLFDVNGYFAPPSAAGLSFYPLTPCRIADTRVPAGFSGQFGPPSMAGGTTRMFNLPASPCGIPATATAYSFNFTVVPPAGGPQANLTTWPATQPAMPNVSTLNYSGSVVANAAIVPAGTNQAIDVFVNYPTDLLFDANGYFAPPAVSGLRFYPVTP